jgi:hypothetical protein
MIGVSKTVNFHNFIALARSYNCIYNYVLKFQMILVATIKAYLTVTVKHIVVRRTGRCGGGRYGGGHNSGGRYGGALQNEWMLRPNHMTLTLLWTLRRNSKVEHMLLQCSSIPYEVMRPGARYFTSRFYHIWAELLPYMGRAER